MDHAQEMTTKRALIVVGTLGFLILLSFIIPAKWVGIESSKKKNPLVLRPSSQIRALGSDEDNNNSPDWRDLVLANFQTSNVSTQKVSEIAKTRIDDPNNLTASFSKNLYVAASYANKSGTITKKDQEDILEKVISQETEKITARVYIIEDLTIGERDDATTKKIYGNALGLLLKTAVSLNLTSDDMSIMQTYYKNQDAALLRSLTIKSNNLEKIISDIQNLSVPYSAAPYHLSMLNMLSEYQVIIENLSQADTDPMRSLIAFNSYLSVTKNVKASLSNMTDYFNLGNITYSTDEPGYLIVTGYTK